MLNTFLYLLNCYKETFRVCFVDLNDGNIDEELIGAVEGFTFVGAFFFFSPQFLETPLLHSIQFTSTSTTDDQKFIYFVTAFIDEYIIIV